MLDERARINPRSSVWLCANLAQWRRVWASRQGRDCGVAKYVSRSVTEAPRRVCSVLACAAFSIHTVASNIVRRSSVASQGSLFLCFAAHSIGSLLISLPEEGSLRASLQKIPRTIEPVCLTRVRCSHNVAALSALGHSARFSFLLCRMLGDWPFRQYARVFVPSAIACCRLFDSEHTS